MDANNIESVYFIGAGGIGMSALVRYFLSKGKKVAGYDRTPSELTEKLIEEGANIHYDDNVELIPSDFCNPQTTLVVYTPAIPDTHSELSYFRKNGYSIQKRAQVLGMLTQTEKGLCVAGTHGKTTTSTMTAHLLHQSTIGCNAFLGGISKNYNTNLLLSADSEYVVIEADEFDRSFHWLSPFASVITATDADHLDIYGTEEAYLESFSHYTSLIRPGGALIVRKGITLNPRLQDGVTLYNYSKDEGDFHAENIRIGNGEIFFDYISPLGNIDNIQLGVPIAINIENGIAAMALAQLSGVSNEEIKQLVIDEWKKIIEVFHNGFRKNNKGQKMLTDQAVKEVEDCIKKYDPEYKFKQDTSSGGCYVATCVYGSYDCPEVWTLRRYRDEQLGATRRGRAFIKFYYAVSPKLVKMFGKTKWFKKMWKGKLDRMVKKLNDHGVENTPYQDKNWN